MTDRKMADEWPGEKDPPLGERGGLSRRAGRRLHLQQIEEPSEGEVYTGIGTELRVERQRRQLTIQDVSLMLRIQQSHLSALEEGRTHDLPGPTYVIGFLRSYSEFLGLDGEEIIRQYKLEETITPGTRTLVFPEPVEEARRPGLSLALISLIIAGAVYGGWIFLERRDLMPIETVAEPPQRLTPYQTVAKAPVDNPVTEPKPAAEAAPAPPVRDVEPKPVPAESVEQTTESTPAVGEKPIESRVVEALPETSASTVAVQIAAATPEPGAGERAAAADVSGLTNNVERLTPTPSASDAETAAQLEVQETAATDTLADRSVMSETASEEDPAPGAPVTEVVAARPSIVPDASPMPEKREGSDVDTAPAMPALQAAIAPPPPPAAPPAPARPLTESGGETTEAGVTGQADLTTASESLGYRPQAYGASNRRARVVLRARAESWVQVQGANNELLLTRMLRAGDSYHAPDRTDLVLMTGNAGAIEITVDGEDLGTLGPLGQVRRNIKLNAEHLRDQMHSTDTNQ